MQTEKVSGKVFVKLVAVFFGLPRTRVKWLETRKDSKYHILVNAAKQMQ